MEQKLLGELFGVKIHSPISRTEVRELVRAKGEFANKKMVDENLTYHQALLDLGDIIKEFINSLDKDDQEKFVNIYADEVIAIQDSTTDVKTIEAHTEAESYHLQAQFIFNELSANLQVYGSNSSMVGAQPANVDLALEYINRSLEIEPENPIYLNVKGLLIWQGKGDKFTAKPLIEKAAKLDPRNITIQHNLKSLQDPNGCFIATAAYGTPLAYEVNELRYWRDTKLNTNILGKLFVQSYYKISPPIANIIKESKSLKSIVRMMLKPLIVIVSRVNKVNR